MANITITLDFSDLTAAATNFPQPTISPGVAPTINWGTLPTPHVDWGAPPWDPNPRDPSVTLTGGSAPSIDMSHARPPSITFPTPQDILTGIWSGFAAATTWNVTIVLVP